MALLKVQAAEPLMDMLQTAVRRQFLNELM